jgi:phosphatidylglycerophosphate synthase
VTAHVHQHSAGLYRRGSVLAASGVVVVTAAAIAVQSRLALDVMYPARVAAIASAILALAVAGLGRWHPYPRIGAANLITGGRALVLALVAGVALAPETPASSWPLVMIAVAGASADVVDGILARRSGMASRFGARFDMEVDALLVLVLSILAWRAAGVGPWIVAAGVMRYVFVAAGSAWPWLNASLPPSRRRQAVCVAQIAALIVAVVPGLPLTAASLVSVAGLLLLGWSFAADVLWLAGHHRASLAVR